MQLRKFHGSVVVHIKSLAVETERYVDAMVKVLDERRVVFEGPAEEAQWLGPDPIAEFLGRPRLREAVKRIQSAPIVVHANTVVAQESLVRGQRLYHVRREPDCCNVTAGLKDLEERVVRLGGVLPFHPWNRSE